MAITCGSENDTNATPASVAVSDSSAAALQQMPVAVRELNRLYLQHIRNRSLVTVPEMLGWLEQPVTVFLRHDDVHVFAVARDCTIGMADFVSLKAVRFHVDGRARQQSNADRGPLPNGRSVHAYLTGELISISDSGCLPDAEQFEPVVYHPLHHHSFVRAHDLQPIHEAVETLLVPGRQKVWCPRITHQHAATRGRLGEQR